MTNPAGASHKKNDSADEIDLGEGGVLRPLITRSEHGSDVLLGTFVLRPGQVGNFSLPHPSGMKEEIYYIVSGALEVTDKDETFTAQPGDAVYFRENNDYQVRPDGNAEVTIIWTGFPPSR